jgi:hypothetical protein
MTRLIGYGAYNLCFDNLLGQPAGGGPDFFQYIRDHQYPVNLVKIICYRKTDADLLPVTNPRTTPLYNQDGSINHNFLVNFQNLVNRARTTNFTVQVCIFSYQSVAEHETPAAVPAVLNLSSLGPCDRVKTFFTLQNAAVVAEQVKLVQALVNQLRYTGNLDSHVIWEIANELRCDVCNPDKLHPEYNRTVNCSIVPWLNRMAQAIRDAAGPIATTVLTSTGLWNDALAFQPGGANEKITFDTHRPADGCSSPAFTPGIFDLHAGQWDATGNYQKALTNDVKYRFLSYGYPSPRIIINDDGVRPAQRTNDLVKAWATAAFQNGYSYSSKQEYPPALPFDNGALDALKAANAAVPGG